jgi:hypothetical protein
MEARYFEQCRLRFGRFRMLYCSIKWSTFLRGLKAGDERACLVRVADRG